MRSAATSRPAGATAGTGARGGRGWSSGVVAVAPFDYHTVRYARNWVLWVARLAPFRTRKPLQIHIRESESSGTLKKIRVFGSCVVISPAIRHPFKLLPGTIPSPVSMHADSAGSALRDRLCGGCNTCNCKCISTLKSCCKVLFFICSLPFILLALLYIECCGGGESESLSLGQILCVCVCVAIPMTIIGAIVG